jgi:hypothetical protein
MPDVSECVAPQDISEHPLAEALREVFWMMENLYGFGIAEKSEAEILEAIRAARDTAKAALMATPTATTPLLQVIAPRIRTAIELLSEDYDNADAALSALLVVAKQIAPAPGADNA